MSLRLRIFPDAILDEVSRKVEESEFGEELSVRMKDMAISMYSRDGVGISGVQVGDLRQILIADISHDSNKNFGSEYISMVNPVLINASGKNNAIEGCLSYPMLGNKVDRYDLITVKYQDAFGEFHERDFFGLSARIVLHEIDHFNGKNLFSGLSRLKRNLYINKLSKAVQKQYIREYKKIRGI